MARGLATELHTPVITTTLKQMVMGFQFAGFGIDDLTSGCQPFLVAYAGSANHYLAVAAADVGNQLSQGEQNASLSDYRSIREKEKVKFPRDISEVCITMNRYAILCQCLFQGAGPPHPFVEMLWATAAGFQNSAPFMAERFYTVARHPGLALTYHARILRAIQVSVHEYMQQVASNVVDGIAGIDLPNFNVLIQELKRGTFHNSTNWVDIPDQYLDAHPSQSGGAPTNAGSSGGASTTATQASTRTGVSTLTADTHARPSSVARVENTAGDPEFAGITLRPGGTRNILREHRPPTNDAGNEFCVAWWTKGGCFPNCGRRATHVPFASASERTRLLAYVRTHLQASGRRHLTGLPGEAACSTPWLQDAPRGKRESPFRAFGILRTAVVDEDRNDPQNKSRTRKRLSASRLLEHLRVRGAAVPTATPPWSQQRRDEAMQRGAHQSSQAEREFVCREMLDFCRQGYWVVVPYEAVRHLPNLRISAWGGSTT
ncbi:adenylate kinase [Fragilaria crotonensis]|nr:adenylate kinase [Fragilaria crotonensis]